MLGSRAFGTTAGSAVTNHPTIAGWNSFNDDEWELYHTEVDRSELHNLADEHPEKVRELVNLWYAEAGANGAFPLDDRSALEIMLTPRPVLSAPRDRYVYFPDAAEVPESQAVNVRNRSFTIGALVDIPAPGAEGVLFAHGSPFGGHALYVKDDRLHRLQLRRHVGGARRRDRGHSGRRKDSSSGVVRQERRGSATSRPPTVPVARRDQSRRGAVKTQPGKFMIAGEGLCIGRDGGAGVTGDYPGEQPWRFTGGKIGRVAVDVSGEAYLDLEREAELMLMRE